MKKRAILYIRVSTDEQASKGYSLPEQREQLERFCSAHGIEITITFQEDYSAKNFDRPEWTKLMQYAKANQRSIDYVLFVAWDRFSRNIADAYTMIGKLKKLEIEPQAITQPLDLNVPQNKIVLAVYLSLPEVDNDIRADRAVKGHRGAKKAGRWTGMAPVGYKNSRDEENRALIVPNEKAPLVRWVFEEVLKNERPLSEIRMELNKRGLYVTRSNFSLLVRNNVYAGKIVVKATDTEPEITITGLHEPIVTEELFDAVQLILSQRKKKQKKHVSVQEQEELPLRGILCCSKCGGHITGSASRSRNGQRHFYYHCTVCKKERYRAEIANTEIEKLLSTIEIIEGVDKLYSVLIQDEVSGNGHKHGQEKGTIQKELNTLEERKQRLQDMLMNGQLEPADYSEMKKRLDIQTSETKSKLTELKADKESLLERMNEKLKILTNLMEWYRNHGVREKKKLLGSIFPQKFIFDGFQIRTGEIDDTVALLLNNTGRFNPKQKGHVGYKSHVTLLVRMTGLEPAHP
jgi:site-specific DNA recombinase